MKPESSSSNEQAAGREQVLRKVKEIVAEQMGTAVDKIEERHALIEDIGCDSLDVVEITMKIEEEFDISAPDEFADKMRTIADVTDGVLQLLVRPTASNCPT